MEDYDTLHQLPMCCKIETQEDDFEDSTWKITWNGGEMPYIGRNNGLGYLKLGS
jgi:hypothetical protein